MDKASLAIVLLLTFGFTSAKAEGVPQLNAISPDWMQRGKTVELTLTGDNLSAASGFRVSGEAGVEVTLYPAESPATRVDASRGGITVATPKDQKKLRIKATIAPDAALGSRELRVVTPEGISDPVVFFVDQFPEVAEQGSPHPLENPQPVQLPAAITGKIGASAEIDCYRFKATKGEHMVFEVSAYRSGSPLDSSLAILNASGQEIIRNEDTYGLDSLIDFAAPEDGDYIAQLRDFRYQGGNDYSYRLTAGVMPHVRFAFPLGAQRGKDVEVEVKGPNWSAGSKIPLHIDAKAPLGRQDIRAYAATGVSNPFPFDIGDVPEFFESEPNATLEQANAVQVPASINGRIQGEKDHDLFRFHADKDERLIFDVLANRFGSPLDALLTLKDKSGKIIKRNDDASGADARIDHQFSEAGDYFIQIEDLLGRNGESFAYRLVVRKPKANFTVQFAPDNPRICQGSHTIVRCELARQNGFSQPVRISAVDLPPGLFCEPLVLTPSDPSTSWITITASPQCPTGTFPLKLIAVSSLEGSAATRNCDPLSSDKPVKEAFISVLESAPFSINAATMSLASDQDAASTVEALLQRQPGFDGEIKISTEGFSSGREPLAKNFDFQPATLKGTDSRAVLTLKAKADSEIGTRPVFLKAEATVMGKPIAIYSGPVPLTVHQIPFILTTTLKRLSVTALPPGSTSAAGEAVFSVKAQRRGGFTNEIALTLAGLPEGIGLTLTNIPANTSETSVRLVASDKAPVGKEFTLHINGTGNFNDRLYKHGAEEIKLSVSAPEEPPTLKTAEAK